MKQIYLTLAGLLLVASAFSQARFCETNTISREARIQSNKKLAFLAELKRARQALSSKLKTPKAMSGPVNGVYTVPIVFHVLHTGQAVGQPDNPTDADFAQAVADLNAAFNNTYDKSEIAGTFNSVDAKIQFVLAKRTPTGANSTGIYRYNMSSNSAYVANGAEANGIGVEKEALINATAYFDSSSYLNVWVVNYIGGASSTIDGSASAPDGNGFEGLLGIFLKASAIGQNKNGTLIHEAGHTFGLFHTFQGSQAANQCPSDADCTVDNDGICDTDPLAFDFTCNPTGTNACSGKTWATSTVQFNHMSYNACRDRFSPGQVSRMTDILNFVNSGFKGSQGGFPYTLNNLQAIAAPTGAHVTPAPAYGLRFVGLNTIEVFSNGYVLEGTGRQVYVDRAYNQVTNLVAGASYPLTVLTDAPNPHGVKVYIDYNNDGVFSTTGQEVVYFSLTPVSQTSDFATFGANITIPSTGVAFDEPLRMRVIADRSLDGTFAPLGPVLRGQAEDYAVIISSSLPVALTEVKTWLNNNLLSMSWKVASEQNVDRYEIHTSTDGKIYTKLGEVASKALNGISETSLDYTFSQNVGTLGLYVSMLAFATLLLVSVKGRKKLILPLVVCLALSSILIYSCKKSQLPEEDNSGNIYVKLIEVDKDGKSTELSTNVVVRK